MSKDTQNYICAVLAGWGLGSIVVVLICWLIHYLRY